jgi:hypothetical protein
VGAGFQFNAAFQPAINRVTEHARALDRGGMALMMLAVALLIVPSAFHRLAEGGHDSGGAALAATAVALLMFLGLWFGYPVVARTISANQSSAAKHEQARQQL